MKTLARLVILVLAAALVTGAAYAVAQSSAAQTLPGGMRGRGGFEGRGGHNGPPAGFDPANRPEGFQPPAGFEGRGGFGEREFDRDFEGGFSAREVLRNLLIVAAIVIIVQLWRLAWRAIQQRRRPRIA